MGGKRYDLVFGSIKVGVVTPTDSDFPNLWGEITYDPRLENPQTPDAARFAKFVALNRESTRLVDMEHEQDVSRELDAINAELESYNDYIESEEWYLIDASDTRLRILCPVLRGTGEIVWRWGLPDKQRK
jgi:hypothetical protein